MITRERKVNFVHRGRSPNDAHGVGTSTPNEPGRVPRVSRLMALAVHLNQMVQDGVVADQAELARLGHVSRARLTQIMNLLLLAPDIQEAILFLPITTNGRESVTERDLRAIAAISNWNGQRQLWKNQLAKSENANVQTQTPRG